MAKAWVTAFGLVLVLGLAGCSQTSNIGQAETDAAFPKHTDAEVEAELKKDPKAWAEYQASRERDAAVEKQSR